MPEPRFSAAPDSDLELERALADLGRRLAYPETPDIAGRVRDRLENYGGAAPVQARALRRPTRPVWLAAGLLAAILTVLLLFPEARSAIAERLGLPGVVMRWVEDVPAPRPSPVAARLMLGQRMSLEEAQAAVAFAIQQPTLPILRSPSEVYLLGEGEGAMVSLVYATAPGLPASEHAGVGALLTQFEGDIERPFIEKGLVANETDAGAILEDVSVGGERGYWITGAPHGFLLVCGDDGECREERYRLAGNVLLWEQNGLTLRFESALPKDEAIAIAESVRSGE